MSHARLVGVVYTNGAASSMMFDPILDLVFDDALVLMAPVVFLACTVDFSEGPCRMLFSMIGQQEHKRKDVPSYRKSRLLLAQMLGRLVRHR